MADYSYPEQSVIATNPSIGPNGAPAPIQSTEIGFIDGSGNLQGVSTTNPLPVDIHIDTVVVNENLAEVNGAPVDVGTGASGPGTQRVAVSTDSSMSISGNVTVVQPSGANLHVDVDASALPTGAATSANQSTEITALQAIEANQTNGTQHTIVDNFPATQPVSGTLTVNQGTSPWVDNITQFGSNAVVTGTGASGLGIPRVTVSNDSNILATQSGTWNINNISGIVSLPTGAATAANQTTLGSQTTKLNDGTNTAAVKAASTAALATDPALVVAVSPNNTIKTAAPINANGTFTGSLSVTTSEASTAAPANAVGVVFEAESSNATNIRWGVSNSAGAILSTSSGVLMEPGRSIDFLPIGTGTFLHYISTAAGTNVIDIQWILSA